MAVMTWELPTEEIGEIGRCQGIMEEGRNKGTLISVEGLLFEFM